jgi:hypothetical protein
MDVNILIDSSSDMNEPNIIALIAKLSEDFNKQKIFIQIIKDTFKLADSGDKNAIIRAEKIDQFMSKAIGELGLPFCDIINESNDIINYYINNYINGKNSEISKKIIINYIHVFNYKSTDANPIIDQILEKLKITNINIKEIQDNKRITKSNIENIYDELNQLYNNWKTIIISETVGEEDYYYKQLMPILKEKEKAIKEMENQKIFSKATIQFLKEKIQSIESLKNKIQNLNDNNNNHNNHNHIYKNKENQPNVINQENGYTKDFHENGLSVEEKNKLKEIDLKKRTSFYLNEYLAYGEDELTEFKNYIYPLLDFQEKEIKRQYIGFLNSRGGRIYIGINDKKYVKGIILSYKDCDIFSNLLVGLSSEFYPQCRTDKIKVHFIPIKNSYNKKFINNLYVVKIIILPGDQYSLYSITKKGGLISAIRLQRQVLNLDAEEITKKIIERYELKRMRSNQNQIEVPDLNLDFNDPEPEKNLFVRNFDNKSESNKSDSNKSNNQKKKNNKCIYIVNVRNIDINLKVKEINKIFNGLQQSYQKFYSKEGKSIGYGKIHFANEEAANLAIKKFNGNNLGGKRNIVMTLQKNKFFNKINK